MKTHPTSPTPAGVRILLFAALAVCVVHARPVTADAAEDDNQWAFKPSYYSHDPASGKRVAKYADGEKAYAVIDNYRRSGYRQQRLRIHGIDGSADNIHMVETWGDGEYIRPYGEWQRPFRAGATPYGPWGNPSGPWTMPFGSWVNPYGLGKLPNPPWPHWPSYSYYPTPYPGSGFGPGPVGPGPGPGPEPIPTPMPSPGHGSGHGSGHGH